MQLASRRQSGRGSGHPAPRSKSCDTAGVKEADVELGEWIRPQLTGQWGTVAAISPAGYLNYVRIFHPAASDPTDQLYSWSHVATVTHRTMHPQAQWQQIAGDSDSERWPHKSPVIGRLHHSLTRTVFAVLATKTTPPTEVYFGVWEGTGWAMHDDLTRPLDVGNELDQRIARLAQGPKLTHPGRSYVLLRGTPNDADAVGAYLGDTTISAHLAWPTDRAWCISTDVDYDSTILACDHDTAETILTHPDIEALPIPHTGRLDINADHINPPRSTTFPS
ncbi:hypothetical protein DFR67_10637 [Williamsia limnetica]|uniref:Uncharacterized protein n=1 Tax=Williamsia limnetica TaxID=882452 RepID=A0A318RVV7_WILLI|nr:hypothetical protein DFR67_10637 [Williamsia limnetica]